jgi:hypothetical protein
MSTRPLLEEAAELSSYHFNPDRIDHRFDCVKGLGQFDGDWGKDLIDALKASQPVSMATRSHKTSGVAQGAVEYKPFNPIGPDMKEAHYQQEKEFFDTTDISYDKYQIVNKFDTLGPQLMKMVNAFKLDAPMSYTFHAQFTGQVFPYHIDFFHRRNKFAEVPPEKLIRIMVMLTDWEPGHFFGYGNFSYSRWKAGDFSTLSHANTPHYSANATYNPRCMLLITGVRSAETDKFLWEAENTKAIRLDDLK